jgi:hypothetical protein
MKHAQMRTDGKPNDTDLDVSKGIVSGRVTQYADALEVETEAVMDAVETAGVTPMVDTADSKARESHDRPDDPSTRCLAMTRDGFARVLAEVQ